MVLYQPDYFLYVLLPGPRRLQSLPQGAVLHGGLQGSVVKAGLGHHPPQTDGAVPHQAFLLQLRLEYWPQSSLQAERKDD